MSVGRVLLPIGHVLLPVGLHSLTLVTPALLPVIILHSLTLVAAALLPIITLLPRLVIIRQIGTKLVNYDILQYRNLWIQN